jgi:putative PIN family toxin of toxin-antitoxin system
MKVVLDTNVLVSALIVRVGKPAQILRQIGKFELLVSEEILAETERVLHYDHIQKRYHPSEEDIATYLEELRETSILVSVTSNDQVIKADPDDDKFLACALDGGADYIVSGDPHLSSLKMYQGISILAPAEFLQLLERE